jgi:uncharacterized protein YfaS (alpha-2-macroglobulin family)
MRRWIKAALPLLGAAAATAAQAVGIAAVSPRGEVAQVRQVTVTFSEAVVPLGDLRGADPMALDCRGPVPPGAGRWINERVWVYDFRDAVGPGVRCTLRARPEWRPLAGSLGGATEFAFSTGGPAIVSASPFDGSEIDEEQQFLLRLSGAVDGASVEANAWCEVEGIGERLPLRTIGGEARSRLLASRRIAKAEADRTLVASCARPLPNGAAIRLVWGKGIATAAAPKIPTTVEQRYRYKVRAAFSAEFSCERERASAPCLPVRPMRLRFSAPVARDVAAQVRLKPASGAALAPVFDKDDKGSDVRELVFPKPLAENATFTVELPPDLKDDAGRALANRASFPLKVATGAAPPLAKFAAAPFGIVEWKGDAMLPVTLRHVQPDLRPPGPGAGAPARAAAAASGAAAGSARPDGERGRIRVKVLRTDADILAWYAKLRRYDETELSARELGLPEAEWYTFETSEDAKGRPVRRRVERQVGTREVSLLRSDPEARPLELPQLQGGDPRPFEVIGIPLPQPGYHVVEIESRRLGESLLDRKSPMFVRTGALVTNLGVHFKLGRENSAVWVTSLDRGRPVGDADVAVNDCNGRVLWRGRTDAQGLAIVAQALDARVESCVADDGYFVTARKADANGAPDTAFVFSSWQKGIEAWRFNVPTGRGAEPDVRAHTVFDRTLLRAGETVSMKHFVRLETSAGLAAPTPAALPTVLKIVHDGSGQEFVQPLQWDGTRTALSSWTIPPAAKLGTYRVVLEREAASEEQRRRWTGGDFRVEEFRLPLVDARISAPNPVPIAPSSLPLDVRLSYLSGGGMAQAVHASALLRARPVAFAGYDDFTFEPPRPVDRAAETAADDDADAPGRDGKLVADKVPLQTDRSGAARVELKDLPKIVRAGELTAEVTFNDPNGEVQTASTRIDLWPSAVVLGVRAASWASNRGKVGFSALALDTAGKPIKGQAVEVRGRLAQVISSRKRMVGGFYAYDNRTEVKELGTLCSGTTDAQGLLACQATLDAAGQVDLIARATDAQGRPVEAAAGVWVTRQGELWFAQDNDDRIDVLPEKKRYEPGETARLQVRMPFREASALVSVEREGILETRVVTLRGDDPTIELPIRRSWGPNVYVSVLALRGRIRETPWYSLFTWGWREPLEWARSFWVDGKTYQAPTALVDLSKPAFKLGVAALKVGIAAHELQVQVTADKPTYAVRQKAVARIKVSQGGKPVAGAEIAFAAVDEALLALRPNASWDLLAGMIRERAWGVETSTAQSEIIGRRHYGRKAVAAGGGGGRGATRELFDTLLIWKARVALDANGEATVEVPLNDALTTFRLVAVADAGTQQFGSGSARIRVTQDLQVLAGLPPLVRDGDRFLAMLTVRNTTAREMSVRAQLEGRVTSSAAGVAAPLALAPQDVRLPAGSAQEIVWPVDVPAEATRIAWSAAADEQGGSAAEKARDRVTVQQSVAAAVPVRVLQATLQQLDAPIALPIAAPGDALPATGVKRGGIAVAVQPKLSGALPGLRRFFETYPFSCLEQKTSKAIGLKDAALWSAIADALPTYLDRDGLAGYFPPRAEDAPHGSDRLTAHVLAASHEAGFALPQPARDAMLDGLVAFVEGRIERRFWSPRADLDVRKIAAIEALSRYDRAQPKLLGSINLTPTLWPTAAVIDWLRILRRLPAIPEQARRLDEAQQILRSRLTYAGTTLRFSNEAGDFWWWLMDSADANASRLVLAVLDDPAWRDDLPRLVVGSLGRQRNGAWLTTTANLWGSLALDKFAARFEAVPIDGRTTAVASTGSGPAPAPASIDWAQSPGGGALRLAWPDGPATLSVVQQGAGKPWLTVQSLAAIRLREPLRAGYSVTRTLTAVEQKDKARWSRGDIVRVRLEVEAQADMTWVVVSDPVPGGATILGSGLGRDSAIATRTERRGGAVAAAFEERGFEAFRSYFDYLPKGRHVVEYTLRLNNPGRFALPPTRAEAMYAPESFGETPNPPIEVAP